MTSFRSAQREDMMRYAETVQCRRQVFRGYFHEPSGEPCGACDNCVNHRADQHPAVELHTVAEQNGVTRIQTIAGTIVTTAPETLPKPVQSTFAAGQCIQHKGFGRGIMQDANGDTLLVRFDGAGMKKLKANFVVAA